MYPSLGHMSYQLIINQLGNHMLHPLYQVGTNVFPTFTYPMWDNIIPTDIPLDPNLYLIYNIGTIRFEPLIF
jgi:hypothetical protein